MSDKLRPCPNIWNDYGQIHGSAGFIQAPKIYTRVVMDTSKRYRVECGCGCKGPMCDTEEAATAAWNTRPVEDALVEALEATRQLNLHNYAVGTIGNIVFDKIRAALQKAGRA